VLNSVALSVTISVAFHTTEDFLYHRSRKPKNVIYKYCFFIEITIVIDIAIDIVIAIAIAIVIEIDIVILFPSCHPLLHRGLG
jgi:hypothetical protein